MTLSLSANHAFGLKGTVGTCLYYFTDRAMLYPSGSNIILYDTTRRYQKFIPASSEITALVVSPNRRYVAIAERGSPNEKPQITIYDIFTLKKRRVLQSADLPVKEYISLSFSNDSRYLISQTSGPDWSLFFWSWEKGTGKMMASVKSTNKENLPVVQVLFSSSDNSIISACGETIFKLYRSLEGTLRQLPASSSKVQAQNFLCHCWVGDDRLVAGSATGELYLYDLSEFKLVLPQSPSDGIAVTCITPTTKGFVIGNANGLMSFYERTDDTIYFRKREDVAVCSGVVIKCISLSPNEASITVVLETNEIHVFSANLAIGKIGKDPALDFLSLTSHSRDITGLDVCLRKTSFVTCSLDHTVKVWNYKTNSVEVSKTYAEEAWSVAIHPMGYQVIVGFVDKLRFMNILVDDLQFVYEFDLRSVREVRFNNGGNVFAAVQGQTIYLFSTYTLESIGSLRGHSQRVKSLCFSMDDRYIISAGIDGGLYVWDVFHLRRVGESVIQRTVQFNAAVCSEDMNNIYVASSDKTIKDINNSQISREFPTGTIVTSLAMSHSGRLLFAGTAQGSVRIFKIPINGEYVEYACHSAPVTRLRASRDDSILFSASEDGSLYMFDIRDPSGKVKTLQELDFSDEVLITKGEIEEKEVLLSETRSRLQERESDFHDQNALREISHTDKIKEVTDRFTQEIGELRAKLDQTIAAGQKAAAEHATKLKTTEALAEKKLEDAEHKFQAKIVDHAARYKYLKEQKNELEINAEDDMRSLRETQQERESELQAEWLSKLQVAEQHIAILQQEREKLTSEFTTTREMVEIDADKEILDQKQSHEIKMANEIQSHIATKNAYDAQRKHGERLGGELETQREANLALRDQIKQLNLQIIALEKESELQRLEVFVREWDSTLREKDKRVTELKRQNTELEKFKFVLDFKILELNKQIEPLTLDIVGKKEEIRKMNEELDTNHKKFGELNFTISTQKTKIGALNKEKQQYKNKLATAEAMIRRFQNDIAQVAQHIQDPQQLKAIVKQLYSAYGNAEAKEGIVHQDVASEYVRQRQHLEHMIESLRHQASKEAELHKRESIKIMKENVSLIAVINDQRRELRDLRTASKESELLQGKRIGGVVGGSRREIEKLVDLQKEEITRLRKRIKDLEDELQAFQYMRPYSRERLPPMEGFGVKMQTDASRAVTS